MDGKHAVRGMLGALGMFATLTSCGEVSPLDMGGVDENEAALAAQNDMGTGRDAANWFGGATAPTVLSGTGQENYIDRLDYYKIAVSVGQTIGVSMTPPAGANFNLYLYKPTARLAAASVNSGSLAESVSFTADVAGDWRVLVYRLSGSGTYSLAITISSPDLTEQNDMETGSDAPADGVVPGTMFGTGTLASLEDRDCYLVDMLAGQQIRTLIRSNPSSATPLGSAQVCTSGIPNSWGWDAGTGCSGGGLLVNSYNGHFSSTAWEDSQALVCVNPQVFEGWSYATTGDYELTITVVDACDGIECGAGASCDPFYQEGWSGPIVWCVCEADPSLYTFGGGDPCSL